MSILLAPFFFLAALLGFIQPAEAAPRVHDTATNWHALQFRSPTPAPRQEGRQITPSRSHASSTLTGRVVSPAAAVQPLVSASSAPSKGPLKPTPEATAIQPAATSVKPAVQTASSFSAVEQGVIDDINAARAASGLKPLISDAKLGDIARAHSADMLSRNYFDHTSTSGCTAVCRYEAAGYAYWSMAENIYWMDGYDLSDAAAAQQIVDSWQNSPGHRANDLGDSTNVGVGISRSGSKVYVTADFSTPR